MGRKETTAYITDNVVNYLKSHGYSVYVEIGVEPDGSRRADVLALNHERDLILVEVKSGAADFRTDTKWMDYLDSCSRMYLAISKKFYKSKAGQEAVKGVAAKGVGVMVIDQDAETLKVKVRPTRRDVETDHLLFLLTRMAFRGGIHEEVSIQKMQKIRKKRCRKKPETGLFSGDVKTTVKQSRKTRKAMEEYKPEKVKHERGLMGLVMK